MSQLAFDSVSVKLGERDALQDLSFEATSGLIALVGPNGSGKTTLLRAAAGLIGSSSGNVRLDDMHVGALTPKNRACQIAYLPQDRSAVWPMLGRDVVALGRFPYSGPLRQETETDAAAIDHALTAANAQAFADRRIDELSGGERARILLARALAVEAPVLLADEPTAALDPAHQLSVMESLKSAAQGGTLILAALHDLQLAMRFADRILVLDDGALVSDGAPEEALTSDVLKNVFGVRMDHGGLERA